MDSSDELDITCYLAPGWLPIIRPAGQTREWMDKTTDAFAYRCLPLNIANSHGWELLSPVAFAAIWNGGNQPQDLQIWAPEGTPPLLAPLSTFGHGVLTFDVPGLFRTSPEWNLWVGGPPNRHKDALQPLTGIVETDWAVSTFTMNWRFTRPGAWAQFDQGEPFCHFFPLQRGRLNGIQPKMKPMSDDPLLEQRFKTWDQSRTGFNRKIRTERPQTPQEAWQRHYFQGVIEDGGTAPETHQTKLRVKEFKPPEGWEPV